MPLYRTPGVYFEWLDSAANGQSSAGRTDVTGFVGIAQRGPLHLPVKAETWNQFQSVFGGFIPQAYLSYAVDGFFANGGRTCWVVRVANRDEAKRGSLDLYDRPQGPDGKPTPGAVSLLRLEASFRAGRDSLPPAIEPPAPAPSGDGLPWAWPNPGGWSSGLLVSVTPSGSDRFSLTFRLFDGTREDFRELSLAEGDPRYVINILNDVSTGSRLVAAIDSRPPGQRDVPVPLPMLPPGGSYLQGGSDGLSALKPDHFIGDSGDPTRSWGIATLESLPEVGIIAAPDIMPRAAVTATVQPTTGPLWRTPWNRTASSTAELSAGISSNVCGRPDPDTAGRPRPALRVPARSDGDSRYTAA